MRKSTHEDTRTVVEFDDADQAPDVIEPSRRPTRLRSFSLVAVVAVAAAVLAGAKLGAAATDPCASLVGKTTSQVLDPRTLLPRCPTGGLAIAQCQDVAFGGPTSVWVWSSKATGQVYAGRLGLPVSALGEHLSQAGGFDMSAARRLEFCR